mgnify:CR=1 FL=1
MAEDEKRPSYHISCAYLGDFERILASADARLTLTGAQFSASEIMRQIAIRSVVAKKNTIQRELAAARAVVKYRRQTGDWPDGLAISAELESIGEIAIGDLHEQLGQSLSELQELGYRELAVIIDRFAPHAEGVSSEDVASRASGIFMTRRHEGLRDRTSLEAIPMADIFRLEDQLMDVSVESTLCTEGRRWPISAFLKIFIRTMWLTGMRPREVFECRLFTGNPDHAYSGADRAEILDDPLSAIDDARLVPMEALDIERVTSKVQAVGRASEETLLPVFLRVKNAKTANANQALVRDFRVLNLEGIDRDDLAVLCSAATLHTLDIAPGAQRGIISRITRRMTAISHHALPERRKAIRLYDLRHDFATRCRRCMSVHEAAALMGHTSVKSTHGYGEKRSRKSSGSRGGWMPGPDPTAVARLEAASMNRAAPAIADTVASDRAGADAATGHAGVERGAAESVDSAQIGDAVRIDETA